MKLGEFLKDAPEAPTEPVTFQAVWENEQFQQVKRAVKARLVFVNAQGVTESRAAAKKSTDAAHTDGDPPPLAYEDLTIYEILYRALRDSDDTRQKFAGSVIELRKAILPATAGDLMRAYNKFVAREFPSTVSDAERAELEEEAKKKSTSDRP